ncbi:AEC family transporter [Oscillibacter sp.]|uniref:AEC family transporter n=1 Tax=Oscillibacter sp. TaxID=1945593 RepID=UPI002626767E|nr:AEC family transporter [Oscillibacter sp.]MDD3347790.1 AEC family transporter [Oscillibacter sp.]
MGAALIKSAILIFLIALGYVLKRVGLFRQEDSKVLSNIMLYVTLPAVLVNAFRDFTMDLHLASFILIGLGVNIILLAVGWKVGAREQPLVHAMYMICMAGFNIGSFAIPFVQNLFPERMMEVIMFDVGNSVMNCGVIYSFAAMQVKKEERFRIKALAKTLLSSFPFDLDIGLFVLALFQFRFPDPIYQLADTVAGANAVVVMLMLGIMFEVRLDPAARHQVVGIVTTRVLTEAVLALAMVAFLPFPLEQRLIAALLVCAPISGMATVFCGKLECNPGVYGTATSLTIPISIAVMIALSLV